MLSKLKATLSLIGTLATCVFLIGYLSGCQSVFTPKEKTEPETDTINKAEEIPTKKDDGFSPNRRDAVVVNRGSNIGGAAIRPVERQHVLYFHNPSMVNKAGAGKAVEADLSANEVKDANAQALQHSLELLNGQLSDSTPAANKSGEIPVAKLAKPAKGEATGYSYYELSRWERYCAGNPDSLDIKFIKRVGGHDSLPAFLKDSCSPKKRL